MTPKRHNRCSQLSQANSMKFDEICESHLSKNQVLVGTLDGNKCRANLKPKDKTSTHAPKVICRGSSTWTSKMEVIVVADEFFFSGSNADGIKWKLPYQMYQLQYRPLQRNWGPHLSALTGNPVIVRFPTWGVWRSSRPFQRCAARRKSPSFNSFNCSTQPWCFTPAAFCCDSGMIGFGMDLGTMS